MDSLARAHPKPASSGEVGQDLRERFGLTIPDRVVDQVLKRLPKKAVQRSGDGLGWFIASDKLSSVQDLSETVATFDRQQADLAAKFGAYARGLSEVAAKVVDGREAELLSAYIEDQAEPLLAKAMRGAAVPAASGDHSVPGFIVASFINNLAETDAVSFSYVVDYVKGALLAAVVQLDTTMLREDLRDLTLVLDSPIIVKALGYEGELQQTAVLQTLELARRLNARTICLSGTLAEVDALLDSVIPVVKSRGRRTGHLRDVDRHFLAKGSAAADLEMERAQFPQELARLGIRERENPNGRYDYGLDEAGLDEMMSTAAPDQSTPTRRHDVDLLSAVHRLRRGSSGSHFQKCKFVAVTDHFALVRVARGLNKELGERHGWPLAMTGNELACLLWVRQPTVNNDLPRQQLMATVHAGMQPGKHLWAKYLDELEILRSRGGITDDEALVLRVEPEARRVLAEVTMGSASVTAETIEAVRERLNRDVRAPVEANLSKAHERHSQLEERHAVQAREAAALKQDHLDLKSDLEQTSRDLRGMQADRQRQDGDIHRRAARNARNIAWSGLMLFALPMVLMAVIKVTVPDWEEHVPSWVRAVGWGLLGLGSLIGAVKVFVKGSVGEWVGRPQHWLACRMERRYRFKAGLPLMAPRTYAASKEA